MSSGTPAWASFPTSIATATTATNIAGGLLGSIPYQTGAGATTTLPIGGTGTYLTVSSGTPAWASFPTSIANITGPAISTTAAGAIPYQTAKDTTSFLALGGASQVLAVNSSGTAPTWTTINTSITINDVSANTTNTYYPALLASASGTMTTINTGNTKLTYVPNTGTLTSTTFNALSDYRIKDNITNLDETFSVDNLRPVTYFNKSAGKTDVGFIAHEVQEEFPYLVVGEKDGEQMQSLNYNGIIGVLVKEIQDLKKRVKELENKSV